MATLEFYDPTGRVAVTQTHAPRLESLEGRRIGFITNDEWQAHRTLPLIARMLEEDFGGIELLPMDAFPRGNTEIARDETAALVAKSGVDAVIIGNAA